MGVLDETRRVRAEAGEVGRDDAQRTKRASARLTGWPEGPVNPTLSAILRKAPTRGLLHNCLSVSVSELCSGELQHCDSTMAPTLSNDWGPEDDHRKNDTQDIAYGFSAFVRIRG
jgi:hypothetical protein